jgi:uncharacterized membrane protein YphA (DoxX/SURF4 family)
MQRHTFMMVLLGLLMAGPVLAHEVYVLSPAQVAAGRAVTGYSAYLALVGWHNVALTLGLGVVVGLGLIAAVLARSTKWGIKIRRWFEAGEQWGLLVVRLSLAAALCMSALTVSFLGPELPLASVPGAALIRVVLFVCSGLLAAGFLTEVAALAVIVIYVLAARMFGWYILTYVHYVGEALVLLIFGAPTWALDRLLFGRARLRAWRMWELLIVRVGYGAALLFATINVKILHPLLTQTVVSEYHLTDFHWLFPSDPLLVVFGAGMVEGLLALCILLGFQTRLVNLVIVFYMTLSLFYFKEAVWPHYMLYGISLLLIFSPDSYGLTSLIDRARRKR